MGSISVAGYRPRPGFEETLLDLVRNHLPPLRAQGLVTERAPIVMRAADGTIVEVFEWVPGGDRACPQVRALRAGLSQA